MLGYHSSAQIPCVCMRMNMNTSVHVRHLVHAHENRGMHVRGYSQSAKTYSQLLQLLRSACWCCSNNRCCHNTISHKRSPDCRAARHHHQKRTQCDAYELCSPACSRVGGHTCISSSSKHVLALCLSNKGIGGRLRVMMPHSTRLHTRAQAVLCCTSCHCRGAAALTASSSRTCSCRC